MAGSDVNIHRADFPHLKWSLLVLLSVLCAGGSLIILSHLFVTHAQTKRAHAQHQLNDSRKQLATALQDQENINIYSAEYGELVKRNIIGDDQRLDWIEGLEKIHQQHLVVDFKYALAPQHPYISPTPLDSGNFSLNMSDMTMQLDLLHEGQLISFFNALHSGIKGWFILEHCTLERSTDPASNTQLKADCGGGWLTLKNSTIK